MKIWRKSRLSECHANLFANGRVRAIYVNIFVIVYDEGVVAEGYVQYTFTPGKPATVGECTIHVYDVFTGDTTFVRDYVLTEDRHLAIYNGLYGTTPSEIYEYDVQRLSAKVMTWHLTNSDVVLNFKKVK